MNTDIRTPLRRAVDKLIADGRIKQDKDLQDIFNLSKSTISAYLNNPRPGKRFVNEFENKFGVSLNEFEIDHLIPKSLNNDKDEVIKHLEDKVKILENHCSLLQRTYEERLTMLEANLKRNQDYLKVVMAQIKAASLMDVQRSAGPDKKKLVEERRALDRLVGEFLSEG